MIFRVRYSVFSFSYTGQPPAPPPPPPPHSHGTMRYLCSLPVTCTPCLGKGYTLLSWVLVTIGNYKKHPLFRVFSGILPKITAKNTPFPQKTGISMRSPYAFEWGGGGRGAASHLQGVYSHICDRLSCVSTWAEIPPQMCGGGGVSRVLGTTVQGADKQKKKVPHLQAGVL